MSSPLLVISTYPSQNTTHTGGGLAIYTKNTLLAIKKADKNQKIIVLCNVIDKKETYEENGITVIRCWDRGFFPFFAPLTFQIFKHRQLKTIFFGFEFAAYGDFATTGTLPFLLFLLRLMGKKITSVIHQVVPSLKQLTHHTGIENKTNLVFYNRLLVLYFKLLNLCSTTVITLEPLLASRFNKITNSTKAVSIPHGLYPKIALHQRVARSALNLPQDHYYILCFGYLSHYKGSDIAVKAFQKPLTISHKKVTLILAGGENPTQGQKHHYKHFYDQLYKSISNSPNIIHSGFVPDNQIKAYYSAADIVIFPYRTFMSASGPLSLAIGYQKPFLVSNKLTNYSPHFFNNNSISIRKTIKKVLSNPALLKELTDLSKKLSTTRNFNRQGEQYLSLFSQS